VKQIDCLAFAPHPDDAELFCSGFLLKIKKEGGTAGIIDLTEGELSSNGDPETRLAEAESSSKILGLDIRRNLQLRDGNIQNNPESRLKLIEVIREYRPRIVLIPAAKDRHPDHEHASALIKDAVFFSGLKKIKSEHVTYRPGTLLYYMMHTEFEPGFCIDITEEMPKKLEAIKCFRSQFGSLQETKTYINDPQFLRSINDRARFYGSRIGVEFAEAYYFDGLMKVNNILSFFA